MFIKETKRVRKKKRTENKRDPKKEEKIYGLNYRKSFLKINGVILQAALSEKSLSPVMLCLAMQRNLTHLDKELKRNPFLCIQTLRKVANPDRELKRKFYFFSSFSFLLFFFLFFVLFS